MEGGEGRREERERRRGGKEGGEGKKEKGRREGRGGEGREGIVVPI